LNPKDFETSSAGQCVKTLRGYWAFIPYPLPPVISFDTSLISLLSEADRLLGELSGTGRLLANPYLLIAPYIRREAVSSSRIEGTQASLNDLFSLRPRSEKHQRFLMYEKYETTYRPWNMESSV